MKGSRNNPGVIPLAIQDIFSYIKQTPGREFLLRVSYLEIYNEIINDLLSPQSTNLKIRESLKDGVFVGNLKEEIVLSPQQVMAIISAGEAHRHVGATNFNLQSSRSHTIFRMVIESKAILSESELANGDTTQTRVSALNLIDLAGSERAEATKMGVRRKEGGYINKSLLTLGNVISKLSQGIDGHIPYRDSKLTRLLQPSLGGNARIAIVCTVSPTASCFEETHNTLKFASRAKRITNKAKLNEVLDDKALIKKYRDKINQLRKKLQEAKDLEEQIQKLQQAEMEKKNLETTNASLVMKLEEQEAVRVSLQEKINRLTKLILVSASIQSPAKLPITPWNGTARTPAAFMNRVAMSPEPSVSTPPDVHFLQKKKQTLISGARKPRSNSSYVARDLNPIFDSPESGYYPTGDSDSDEPPSTTENNSFKPLKNGRTKQNHKYLDQIKSLQSTVEKLTNEVKDKDEELMFLKLNLDYVGQRQNDLEHELHCKDSHLEVLAKEIKNKEAEMKTFLAELETESGKELIPAVVHDMYSFETLRLKEQLVDNLIREEALRADNIHLMQSLEDSQELIREWADFFESFEQKQRYLENEIARLKEEKQKTFSRMIPKAYSDSEI
eukprot:CAMPEP_0174259218 /NCGR_PEP_ID=MMETSP0439-20130205/8071_1 /TAXON_ID=0 /ORGANISM="Stereomyxa ramosa, Strain Chinc5" /LENGTH=614 /DNA_ID=CAMNT_0015343021 /DNA_START=392 /DNA_END=2236 /DNA_ORIENTATION=+